MRQLTPGGLALSSGLQSADPAAIAGWSATTRAGAQVLSAAAGRLDGLCSSLPGGLWASPAAMVFVSAGREQARRLRVAAALLEQLADLVARLASALGQARERALAAVVRGARLDAEVQAFNDRMHAQHVLLPQDPDGLLVADCEAQALVQRLAAAAGELADAEAAARRAWQHAAADGDLVSYSTPALRERMVAGSWDPAAQVRLAAAGVGATTCGPMEELGLPVGGVLTGPDGRSYPLVVQTARGAGGTLLVTTREQAAEREGWTRLALRVGTTAYGRKASTWEKVAVALGGAAGASYPEGSTFAPELLGQVHIMAGGGAHLADQSRAPIDAVKEAPAEAPRGKDPDGYWVAPTSGLAGGRRATAPDAIGLIDAALGGYLLAKHLDDGRAADYRVVFEENARGALRARMQLFRVLTVPGEQPRTLSAGGYVDSSGHLAGIPTTGEAPGAPAIMVAARH